MSSVGPRGLTDGLWLAAYDSVDGKPWIGEWPLGVGLATGLLVELARGGYVELRAGELFRLTGVLPDDPALRPLLIKMRSEEEEAWSSPVSPSARGVASADKFGEWVGLLAGDPGRPPVGGAVALSQPSAVGGGLPAVRERRRHRRHGHQLGTWLPYLAYGDRAEQLVVNRMQRSGLVRLEQRRRLLGRSKLSPVPYDSVVAGLPASAISVAVHRGQVLRWDQLVLAGLFLATGLHYHALSTLSQDEMFALGHELRCGLDGTCQDLLQAADVAVAEAAMR